MLLSPHLLRECPQVSTLTTLFLDYFSTPTLLPTLFPCLLSCSPVLLDSTPSSLSLLSRLLKIWRDHSGGVQVDFSTLIDGCVSHFGGRVEARGRAKQMQRLQDEAGMGRGRKPEGGEEGTQMEEGYLKVLKRCCQCMKGCTEAEYRLVEKRIHPLFRSLNTASLLPYLPSLLSLAATLLPLAGSVTPSLSLALSHQLTTFDIT